MNKKVLVIPPKSTVANDLEDKFTEEDFWDDAGSVTCDGDMSKEQFLKKYSPGPLLAEVKAKPKVHWENPINGKRDLRIVFPEGEKVKADQPVTVLILGVEK